MINGRNFFDQPIKNDQITYDNIRKIVTGIIIFIPKNIIS